MKPIRLGTLAVFLTLLLSESANADDFFMGKPTKSEDDSNACEETEQGCNGKWAASIEFGYVAVSGNTDTTSFNGRFALSYEIEKWRHAGFISGQSSKSEEKDTGLETVAEKYTAQLKSDYKYTKSAYAFGIVDYDNTKDSGFEYQASYALGTGYRFIGNDKHTLDGEVGLGVRKSKIEASMETQSETIVRLAGLYKWQITKNSSFEQRLSSEVGEDNTISKSYSGLSANILDNLALKVSYDVKHQTDVPVGNEKRETVTSFTVVYTF